MSPWAVQLAASNAAAAVGSLRLTPGVRALQDDESLWIAGDSADDDLQRQLKSLPGVRRFAVGDDGQLTTAGARVPLGYLPKGDWQPLAAWLRPEIGPAALAGQTLERISLKFIRGGSPADANVLALPLADFATFADNAPQGRLDRLTFAATSDGRAIVRGNPLPPLPGVRWIENEGVAIEAGWTWTPRLDPTVIREALRLDDGDLALLHCDATWTRIRHDDFVRATRSAIRLTLHANQIV